MREPLDSDLERVVETWTERGVSAWHELGVEQARIRENELFTPTNPPTVSTVEETAFDGPDGKIRVRVYRHGDPPLPTVVFFHGGGWIMGTLDSADDICRELARRTPALVLSIEYRLAPEHPFPASVRDANAAIDWASREASRFGGDPTKLHVAGTSAGANLAVGAVISRGDRDPELAGQLLAYPILDANLDRPSHHQNADGPFLTRADIAWFWSLYCPNPDDRLDPRAAPLRAYIETVAALPPTTVLTAGHDPLRDEGMAFARRLDDAGVSIDHHHLPSLAHGVLSMTDEVPAASSALDELSANISNPPSLTD